jgi:hypothetical protein
VNESADSGSVFTSCGFFEEGLDLSLEPAFLTGARFRGGLDFGLLSSLGSPSEAILVSESVPGLGLGLSSSVSSEDCPRFLVLIQWVQLTREQMQIDTRMANFMFEIQS